MKTLLLYIVTAVAEIVGCYLPWRWLKEGGSAWLLLPGALSLALFAWLLTFHGTAAGRVYAAYGGVYVAVSALTVGTLVLLGPILFRNLDPRRSEGAIATGITIADVRR